MLNRKTISLFALATILASLAASSALAHKKDGDKIKALEARIEALEKKIENMPKKAVRPGREPQTEAYKIPAGTSHYLGAKKAPVVVTVFSDLQCPFCARVDPMLRDAVNAPGLKGQIKVVWKHFPLSFHKDARPAAKAALAAGEQGNDMFWAFAAKAFSSQRELTSENFSVWARDIGLDVRRFEKDLKNNEAKYERIIKEDMKLGQNAARVRGTPSIFVGGWDLRQRSIQGIKDIIKEKGLGQKKRR